MEGSGTKGRDYIAVLNLCIRQMVTGGWLKFFNTNIVLLTIQNVNLRDEFLADHLLKLECIYHHSEMDIREICSPESKTGEFISVFHVNRFS